MSNKSVFLTILLFAFGLFVSFPGFSESRYTPAVRAVVEAAFAKDTSDEVIAALVAGAGKQTKSADKKQILSLLADYEERLGRSAAAAARFNEAAFCDPAGRDDALLLDSARCYLSSRDTANADALVRAVLLTSFDDAIIARARVYSAWIQLATGERKNALPLIRSFSSNAAYAAFAPQLLFTLWWAENDESAKKTLLATWPKSAEAAVARGEAILSPGPFWYLMERNADSVASFAESGSAVAIATPVPSSAPAVTPSTTPLSTATPHATATPVATVKPAASTASTPSSDSSTVWQQAGFFRNREYAEDLTAKLVKAGFKPVIREEKRPSGTVYYSVLILEDENRTIGPRLKDAGFESFLLFE